MRWKFLVLLGLVFVICISLPLIPSVKAEDVIVGTVSIQGNNPKTGEKCTWPNGKDNGDGLAGYWGSLPADLGDYDLTFLHLYAQDFYYDDDFLITLNDKIIFISVGRDINTYREPNPNPSIYIGADINGVNWNPSPAKRGDGYSQYTRFPLTLGGTTQAEQGINYPCSEQRQDRCPPGVKQVTKDLDIYIDLSSLDLGSGNKILKIYATGDNDGDTDCRLDDITLEYGIYTPVTECGNSIVEGIEECDDGNLVSGDGCSSNCIIEVASVCGNNILETGEECDDGNLINEDGCSDICKIEIILPVINLTSAYWKNSENVAITQITVGQQVKLVIEGSNLAEGAEIKFEVWEKDEGEGGILDFCGSDDLADTQPANAIISGGKAETTWIVPDEGDCVGLPEYYFRASLVNYPNIVIESGLLSVSEECVPLTCSQILENIQTERNYVVDIYGDWPDNCDSTVSCGECEIGTEVIEDPPLGYGVCITEALSCENYLTNETCENYNPEIAVASQPDSERCNKNDGEYGDNGECFYYINCTCKWENIRGCIANQITTVNVSNVFYGESSPELQTMCSTSEPPNLGDCERDFTVINDCDNSGEILRSWNISWTGASISCVSDDTCNQEEYCDEATEKCIPGWCANGNDEVRCLSQTLLGFFNTANLIVAILIIVIFYLIVIRKKKKYKGNIKRIRRK